MTTIETKITKNGSKRCYVREENGKLSPISRDKAKNIEIYNTREIMDKLVEQSFENIKACICLEHVGELYCGTPEYFYFSSVKSAIDAAAKILKTFGRKIICLEVNDDGAWNNTKVYAYKNENGELQIEAENENKMTITTKENAAGKISAYLVDGVKVRKSEIEALMLEHTDKIIEIDYSVGREFKILTHGPRKNLKVIFTGDTYGKKLMSAAAAEELGIKIDKEHVRIWGCNYYGLKVVQVINDTTEQAPANVEADVEDYSVSPEAQDSATEAEIELANTEQAPAIVESETDGSEEDDDSEEFIAVIPTNEDDDDDENNEPEILNADIFNNLYQSPHDERFSSRTIKLGTDALYFNKQKLTTIYGRNGLSLHFRSGKMQFRSNGRIIARGKVAEIYMNSQIAIEQGKTFTELLKASKAHDKGFFEAWIAVTFADTREHHVSRCFDKFNDAKDFVDHVRKIFADSPVWAVIQVNKQCGHSYYRLTADGSEFYDLPNVEFFKDYTREEIQNRIAEIDKAIEDTNTAAKNEQGLIWSCLCKARHNLEDTRDFYEFALREADLKTEREIQIGDDILTFINGNLDNVYSTKYGAMIQFLPDGGRKYFTRPLSLNGKSFDNDFDRWDIEDFFAILTERGAFTTDHKAKPLTRVELQGMLEKAQMTVCEKQDALEKAKPAERQKAQYELDRAFDALTGLERLLADSEDDAPDADDELIDPPAERNLADSLARAMKIALENIQTFCRDMNLTAINRELQLYNICSEALHDLRKEIA